MGHRLGAVRVVIDDEEAEGSRIGHGHPAGGTLECPADKNRAGCPCNKVGEKAACWPGTRKDRHHGVCMDGMTECKSSGEADVGYWGDCVGFTLPTPNVTTGAGACKSTAPA